MAVAVYGTAPYGIGREVENKVVSILNFLLEYYYKLFLLEHLFFAKFTSLKRNG